MQSNLCPICESGNLHEKSEQIAVEHLGISGFIESRYSECDSCGSEQAGADEARLNKRSMIAFKKQCQGLLTGEEVRSMRKKWKLNQSDAAKVFGGGPVAFSKYESDDVMQSEAMDHLLRLANDIPIAFDQLLAKAGIERKQTNDWTTPVLYPDFQRGGVSSTERIYKHNFEEVASYG